MLNFLRTRLAIIIALVLTALAFYGLLSRQALDADWMLRWNHVDSRQVQTIYLVLIIVLIVALPFASQLQALLQRGRVIVLVLAAVTSFLSIHLLEPLEEHRLFISPFSIWIMIAHMVALAGIAVWVVLQSSDANDATLFKDWLAGSEKWLVGLFVVTLVALMGLHIASVGEFMTIDTPDEPWLTSMATNYAENNDLSPTFIGSSYGSPDPVLPRYYWLMGLWLRPAGSSLVAMRMMPLFVLALVLIIMAALLWSVPTLTRLQRLGGLIVLLSISVLVRTSHNLRADVGLALYGAIMVWALLQMFSDSPHRNRWIAVGGLALYLGLETIPFIVLVLATVTGVMLIAWLVRHHRLRSDWPSIVLYGLCCGLALGLYGAVRFLPNVQVQISGYQRFNSVYSQATGLATLRLPIDALINSQLRFSLILSPIELFAIIAAFILCWRYGTTSQRWLLITFGLALVLMQIISAFAYSYWTLFVPLAAYAAACALRSRRILLIGSFVLMPALVAVPVNDMLVAAQTRPNQTYLSSLDLLTPHVPTGIRMIGESALWYTLHSGRYFIGVDGFWIYANGHPEYTADQAIDKLGVDAVFCSQGNTSCELITETGLFAAPETYTVGNSAYLLYWRLKP